ncbi:MAG: M56 family metallopeptidase [Verrucomicrobiota bacterium]
MNGDSIYFINFALHSLILGSAGWGVVLLLRDPLHRSAAAGIALVFCVIGPFVISEWPYPYMGKAPLLTAVHETLETDWRTVVPAVESVPEVRPVTASAASPAPKPAWNMDDLVRGLRWLFWTGLVTLLLRHLWRTARVLRWSRTLRPPNEMEVLALPSGMDASRLRVFDCEGSPCAVGWLRPVIAVPASSFQTLTPTEWQWMMGHEQEHLRMGDTLHSWIQECLRAFLWWNPFAHLLMECHARAREEVCDAAALRESQGRDHRAYADFLLMWAAQPRLYAGCVTPMAHSLPARRLRARLVALMQARGVQQRLGAAFCLGCIVLVLLLPMIAASFGIARASAAEAPASAPAKTTSTKKHASILFTQKVIRADVFLHSDRRILRPDEVATFLKTFSTMKQAELLGAPNVATSLKRTEVMGLHEMRPGSNDELAGVRTTIVASDVNQGRVVVDTKVELGIEEGPMKEGPPTLGEIHWDCMKRYEVSAMAELATNEGLIIHLKTAEKPVTILLVARALEFNSLAGADRFSEYESSANGNQVRLNLHGTPLQNREQLQQQLKEIQDVSAKFKASKDPKDIQAVMDRFKARMETYSRPPAQIIALGDSAVFQTKLGEWRLTPILRKSDNALLIRVEALHEKPPAGQVRFSTMGSNTEFLTGLDMNQELAGRGLLTLYPEKPAEGFGERISVRADRVVKVTK